MTQSPSPSVDEVAERREALLSILRNAAIETAQRVSGRRGPYVFDEAELQGLASELAATAASLVSPPKAGEPVPVAWRTDIFESLPTGKLSRLILDAEEVTDPDPDWKPLYANHEARGDGVRVTDGWKLVPLEPTKEMIDAGLKKNATNPHPWCPAVYRAMIKAAPSVEIQRERVNRLGDDQFPDEGTWR